MVYEMAEEAKSGEGGPDTKEAEALAAALNHSAERVQTLWFSFLTFMIYLAVATGTTTHRMLFLEEPLNLPVLNIALPLLGFYILTPIIFVVLHFYMLLNLVLLARTAKTFEDALARAFPEDGDARENFRMRIENTLFVQLLVGGRLEREGINARLLSLMALITLALAPVALLLFLQIKFLPYHSEWITWLHRSLLLVDLWLVWTLWPGYRVSWGVVRLWPKVTRAPKWPAIASAAVLAYAVMVATFPDEQLYVATYWLHGSTYFDPDNGLRDWPITFPYTLIALIAPVNTLDLYEEDLINDEKPAHILEKNESSTGSRRWTATLSLKSRDLTGVNLSSADVRHVDFTGAILNRANLAFAWATKANFLAAELQGASLLGAQLQGASLYAAGRGARRSTAHGSRARIFSTRSFRAPRLPTRISRAPTSAARGSRAPRSPTRSFRAPRSSRRGSRAPRSPGLGSRERHSAMRLFGEPTRDRPPGRIRSSPSQKPAQKEHVLKAMSEPPATGRLPHSRTSNGSSPSKFPKSMSIKMSWKTWKGSNKASIQARPWKARAIWRRSGRLANARLLLRRSMKKASSTYGASWAVRPKERPTCFMD
jgi:hypothetical protein